MKKKNKESQIEFLKRSITNLLEKILNEENNFLVEGILNRFEERCKVIDKEFIKNNDYTLNK